MPSGPTVVATYGLALLLLALILYVARARNRQIAFRNLAFGIVVLIFTSSVFYGMVTIFRPGNQFEDPRAVFEQQSDNPANQSNELDLTNNSSKLLRKLEQTETTFERIEILKELVKVDEKEGIFRTIQFLESNEVPFLAEEAISILKEYAKTDFEYDSAKSPKENSEAVQKFYAWWRQKYN